MVCLSSARRTEIIAEIVKLDALIVVIESTYTSALTNGEVEEYRFDSGDGSQKVIRRSLNELKEQWDDLKSERNRLNSMLNGGNNVSMAFRRKQGCGFGRVR